MKQFFIFLVLVVFNLQGAAQVAPPDFICVDSDTLRWNLPSNSCGPFISYDIYSSANYSGPFTLLISVTDPNLTFYFDDGANGNLVYYFMNSNFNCPGETVINSDTLDNLAPEIAPMQFVSVENGRVQLEWAPSPSPQTNEYIIYRETAFGLAPIDTVDLVPTAYIDAESNPEEGSETYYVLPLDECGNTSIFDLPHATVHLDGIIRGCEQEIALTWNLYIGWGDQLSDQELWLSINGFPADQIALLGASDTSYVVPDINEGDYYCFYIRSNKSNSSVFSNSNEFCLTPELVQPARDLFLKNVSVTPGNEVDITWTWNTNAELQTVEVLNSTDNSTYQQLSNQVVIAPLSLNNQFTDNESDPSLGPVYYRIQTTDDCDTLALSNYGLTSFLSGSPNENLTNQLNWTDFYIDGGNTTAYEIYRIVNGQEMIAGSFDASMSSYIDAIDVNNSEESNVCYYILAYAQIQLPSGAVETIISRSNTVCVEQLSTVLVPNAFIPGGKTSQFKPLVVFPDEVIYLLEIYDRWGQKIFVSTDINEGWDGNIGFRAMPAGSYIYYISIEQPGGRIESKKGSVVLLR